MAQEKLTVCILNYNGKKIIKDCIRSVQLQSGFSCVSIVVIDNNSTDESWKLVKDTAHIIHASNDHKFITGLNAAFKNQATEKIVFMENDLILYPGCLENMMKVSTDKNIVQPIFLNTKGKIIHGGMNWVWPGYGISKHNKSKETDVFATTMFMMSKDVFDDVGEFDTNLAPAYYEDVDYSLRAKKKGYKLIVCPEAKAMHYANFSFSQIMSKRKISDICHRNRRYTIKKHYKGFNLVTRLLVVNIIDKFRKNTFYDH